MLTLAPWAASEVPGSSHPDAQYRIVSHRTDTLDGQLGIGITTSVLTAQFCGCLG